MAKGYKVSPPIYLGELPIKVELFSEPFNPNMQKTVKGWKFVELEGFAIVNPRPRGWRKFHMNMQFFFQRFSRRLPIIGKYLRAWDEKHRIDPVPLRERRR